MVWWSSCCWIERNKCHGFVYHKQGQKTVSILCCSKRLHSMEQYADEPCSKSPFFYLHNSYLSIVNIFSNEPNILLQIIKNGFTKRIWWEWICVVSTYPLPFLLRVWDMKIPLMLIAWNCKNEGSQTTKVKRVLIYQKTLLQHFCFTGRTWIGRYVFSSCLNLLFC